MVAPGEVPGGGAGSMGVAVRLGASFASDPEGGSVEVELLFPDGKAVLDLVDDEAAGVEGFSAVWGGDDHEDGGVPDGERSGAVDGGGVIESEALDGLGDDAGALLRGDGGVGLVFEAEDGASFVVIAHGALEDGDRAGMGRGGGGAEGGEVEGLGGELEHWRGVKRGRMNREGAKVIRL